MTVEQIDLIFWYFLIFFRSIYQFSLLSFTSSRPAIEFIIRETALGESE